VKEILPGHVYVVGAGPGDPDLLTVRAHALLQAAGVVLHDDLVAPEILALANPQATVMNVGKRCGAKRITQDEINALMIETARLGFAVVRLKSGDPAIFGRLAEELDALDAAQISYEIVPGITAALGAAASLGVSLTDRRTSSRVVIVTAHQSLSPSSSNASNADSVPGEDWKSLARPDTTLVVYMPGHEFATLRENLLAAGLPLDTPATIVSHASTPRQREVSTTLGEMVARASEAQSLLQPPTILLIGRALARAGRNSRRSASSESGSRRSAKQPAAEAVASRTRDLAYQSKGASQHDD
jgi:uroporphyrin-III C-methyltransferase